MVVRVAKLQSMKFITCGFFYKIVCNYRNFQAIHTNQYCFNNCKQLCKSPTYDVFYAVSAPEHVVDI